MGTILICNMNILRVICKLICPGPSWRHRIVLNRNNLSHVHFLLIKHTTVGSNWRLHILIFSMTYYRSIQAAWWLAQVVDYWLPGALRRRQTGNARWYNFPWQGALPAMGQLPVTTFETLQPREYRILCALQTNKVRGTSFMTRIFSQTTSETFCKYHAKLINKFWFVKSKFAMFGDTHVKYATIYVIKAECAP